MTKLRRGRSGRFQRWCIGITAAVIVSFFIIWWNVRDHLELDSDGSRTSEENRSAALREVLIELALGRRAAEQQDYEAALLHIDRATVLEPDSISANLLKGELLFRLHRADEMPHALEAVLRIDPDHFEAHANMAFSLRYSGRLDEAEEHVKWCLSRQPDFLPVRRIRAEIFRDRGDTDRALSEIREVLKSHSADLESRLLEAELLMYNRDFEAAYRSLSPLSATSRQHHRFAALMAQLCQLLGKDAESAVYRDILHTMQSPGQTTAPEQL